MPLRPLIISLSLLALALPQAAEAAVTVRSGTLSGSQEVPANSSPGSGFALAAFDDVTNILSVQTTFAGLLGNTAAAHIHCCAPAGVNAGVATPVPSFPGFPTGVTFGSYNATFDLTLASSFNPAFITANGGTVDGARAAFVSNFLAGRTYFNLHTSSFPNGELRAQLLAPVPEPGTWALMLLGFGAIGLTLRRRRRDIAQLA